MFDDPNGGSGVAFAVAAGNRRIAQEVAQTAERNAAVAHAWKAEADKLAARVRELELALAVEKAHAAGREAQFDAYEEAYPTSPLRADSGKRFARNGLVKTRGRLIYEATFDRIAVANGIRQPTEYRVD